MKKLIAFAGTTLLVASLAACGSASVGTYDAVQTTTLMNQLIGPAEASIPLSDSQFCYAVSLQGPAVAAGQLIQGYDQTRKDPMKYLDKQAVTDFLTSHCSAALSTAPPTGTFTANPNATPSPQTCTTTDVATHKVITVQPGDNAVIGSTEETCGNDGAWHPLPDSIASIGV